VGGSSPAALRRAAERGDGWLPQGRPAQGLRAAIAELRARREELHPGAPFTVGGYAPPIHVGPATWDVGEHTLHGEPPAIADALARLSAVGVDVVQLRFRSRSAGELVEQIDAFGAEVAPLVRARATASGGAR
jgi:alkanesulfonate monooxygenase SsuD/methylene tetrahydromethanopterin reductase-like flavin-dependent oxidoreductase (luciferase family)